MRRYWIILALAFVAATTEENRLYRVAEAAFNDKIYDVAERQFSEFLEKFPHSDRADGAQLLLAEAQLNQGKSPEAVRTLQDALTKWPDKRPDSFRFWLAEALARDGKFAEAAARYEEVVEKFPRSPYRAQALYGLAFVPAQAKPVRCRQHIAGATEKTRLEGRVGAGSGTVARPDLSRAGKISRGRRGVRWRDETVPEHAGVLSRVVLAGQIAGATQTVRRRAESVRDGDRRVQGEVQQTRGRAVGCRSMVCSGLGLLGHRRNSTARRRHFPPH